MKSKKPKIKVALAGNANVGKSVIFNHLTGLHQHIGNWPGKTIEKVEGSVFFEGNEIEVIDLPGIYSLSTYSLEEIVSRDYILSEKPDIIINVIDGAILERNLFFTLQLMELSIPMIIVINQIDMAQSKGIKIDFNKLEALLGIPIVPAIATKGKGFNKLLKTIIAVNDDRKSANSKTIQYGQELETHIERLQQVLEKNKILPHYPRRWLALKILEEDKEIIKKLKEEKKKNFQYINEKHKQLVDHNDILTVSRSLIIGLEELHNHSCGSLISSERYHAISCIIKQVQQIKPKKSPYFRDRLDSILLHPVLGYLILFGTIFFILYSIFVIGDKISNAILVFFDNSRLVYEDLLGTGILAELIWAGLEGLIGGLTIALPYILPFYLILSFLEDSGYMTRIAFMMDRVMHVIGLHGKAFIPCMLGIGCNVPACLGCRIMERHRDRLLAIFIVTLIPCAAQSIIIFALVGKFVGFGWVIALYLFNLAIILILGRIAFKILPGESMGLIMEMVPLRKPNLKVVLTQTWFRLKEFIYIAIPIIILGSIFLKSLEILDILTPINIILSPITVLMLGLPEETGIALIFGITRKELAVILLGTLFGTTDFASVMTPVQMIVFCLVTMLYIPCIATIAALKRELGSKKALLIVTFEIIFALIVGVIVSRILLLIQTPLGL